MICPSVFLGVMWYFAWFQTYVRLSGKMPPGLEPTGYEVMLHMKKPKAQIHANNLFLCCNSLKWQSYMEICWVKWCLPMKFAEVKWKNTWTFIKAQTRIQNDLEQPNPNFPFSGLRLLEAVHVGWLELPSCQFTSWWNVFQGLVMFHVFVLLSFLKMLHVFECILMSPFLVKDCCVLFFGQQRRILCVWPGIPEENVEQPKWTRYPMSPRYPLPFCPFHIVSSRFFVGTSHHQDVWPLCDEPWTPLAGLRGLSFSIKNGVDLGACSKEVLISARSTWSIQHEYVLIINDGILPVR